MSRHRISDMQADHLHLTLDITLFKPALSPFSFGLCTTWLSEATGVDGLLPGDDLITFYPFSIVAHDPIDHTRYNSSYLVRRKGLFLTALLAIFEKIQKCSAP